MQSGLGAEGKILPPDGQMLYDICYVNMRVKSCPGDNKNISEGSPYVPITYRSRESIFCETQKEQILVRGVTCFHYWIMLKHTCSQFKCMLGLGKWIVIQHKLKLNAFPFHILKPPSDQRSLIFHKNSHLCSN